MMADINIVAVLVAALLNFLVGGLWYSKMLFGARWMQETGITEEKAAQANMARTFGLAMLASLVIAFNLSMFLGAEGTASMGAFYGFLTGIGWVAMSMGINDLFEQRSFKLYAINASYCTVSYTLMGALLGGWH